MAWQAMDSGVAALSDGSEVRFMKGEVVLKGERKYELVLRDEEAFRRDPARARLFLHMDLGDEAAPPEPKIPLRRKSP
jgi:hypothetical protein